jgi:hypothetical protein
MGEQRQAQGDGGAGAGAAVDADLAVVGAREGGSDREAEAAAVGTMATRALAAEIALEDARQLVGRMPIPSSATCSSA